MTSRALIGLSIVSLGVTVRGTARRAPNLDGDWAGVITIGGHTSPVRAHLQNHAASEASGSIDLFGDATGTDLRSMRVSGDSFTAVIPLRLTGPTVIRARVVADTMIGEVRRGNQTGSIRLLHLAPLDTAAAHHDEGLYVAGGDTLIVDRVSPDLLSIVESSAHALRILYPVGSNDYIAGPTLFGALPERWRVRIRAETTDTATLTLARDGRTITARRVPLHIEDVSFKNDTVSLAGAFIRPAGPGRFPVVVHLHGSGASIRTSHLGIAYYLAAHGIASLIYDKRGTLASSGTLTWSRYDDLAADAVAGAELLMTRSDVDTNHIGFAGISEGAGTSERAAALFRKTAFVIPISGGPLAANVWEYYETANQLVTDGRFSAHDTADAMSFLRARDYYARTRRGWAKYDSLIKVAVAPGSKWFGYATTDLYGWATPNSVGWDQKALTYFDDPLPTLRTIQCPVLSINGAYDTPPALAISVPLMKRAFAEGGNRDVTIRILPNANHNLFLTKSGNEHEMDNVAEFSPELFPLVTSWIEAKVNPFIGDWKLNVSKSTLTDRMKVKSAGGDTYTFDFGGGPETIAVDGIDHATTLYGGSTLSVAIDGDTWKVVRKTNGRIMLTAIWSLSKDGSTLVDHYTGFDAAGRPYTLNYVYKRVAGGSKFTGTWVSTSVEPANYVVVLRIRAFGEGGLAIVDSSSQLTGNMQFSAPAVRRLNEHAAELLRKKSDGELSALLRLALSSDLETLTLTPHTAREDPYVLVFDRQ